MAYESYVVIEGNKQGKFKGESTRTAHKDKIGILRFDYQVKSPRDAATGQASGKRQHGPVKIVKEWGPSSPQIFQALTTNEVLKKVSFEFFQTDKQGQEVVYYKVTLTNATVSDLSQFTGGGPTGDSGSGSAKHGSAFDTHELEQVSFTFETIDVESVLGKTSANDSWLK